MDQQQDSELNNMQSSLDTFDHLLKEKDYRIDYKCSNCIFEFAKHVVAYLHKKNFLIIEGNKILPTPLGKAAFASSISPDESLLIFNDLLDARQSKEGLVLETDLHLLYLISPHFKNLKEPNW